MKNTISELYYNVVKMATYSDIMIGGKEMKCNTHVKEHRRNVIVPVQVSVTVRVTCEM